MADYTDPFGNGSRYHANKVVPLREGAVPQHSMPKGTIEDVVAAHHPKFHQTLQAIAATTRDLNGKPLRDQPPMNMVEYMRHLATGFDRSLTLEPATPAEGRAYEVARAKGGITGDVLAAKMDTNHGPLVEFQMSGMRDSYCVGTVFNAVATSYPEIAHALQAKGLYDRITTANADAVKAEIADYQKPVDMAALYTIGKELNIAHDNLTFDSLKEGSVVGFSRSLEQLVERWEKGGRKGEKPTQSELELRGGSHAAMVTAKGTENGREYLEITSGNNQFGAAGEDIGGGGFVSYKIYKDELQTDGVVREPGKNGRAVGWAWDPDKMQAYHEQNAKERGLDPTQRVNAMSGQEVRAQVAREVAGEHRQALNALAVALTDGQKGNDAASIQGFLGNGREVTGYLPDQPSHAIKGMVDTMERAVDGSGRLSDEAVMAIGKAHGAVTERLERAVDRHELKPAPTPEQAKPKPEPNRIAH